MEREHELATEVVIAVLIENGETAQFVIRDVVRRSSGDAYCPNWFARGQEAEQEMLSCLV